MKEFFISLARDSISVRNESIHGQAKGRELDLGVVLYIHTHTHIDLDEENVCVRVSDADKISALDERYMLHVAVWLVDTTRR